MNIKMEFIIDQINESRAFVNRLISELPQDLWFKVPENTDSNFAWQIGHLMCSQNFHAIICITGVNSKVSEVYPHREYVSLFNGMGALHRSVEENLILPEKLKEQFDKVHEICLENLWNLNDDMLENPLEPLPFKHPVANTKYEALSWYFKHEMWHCAEMEDIKRALGFPIKWM